MTKVKRDRSVAVCPDCGHEYPERGRLEHHDDGTHTFWPEKVDPDAPNPNPPDIGGDDA